MPVLFIRQQSVIRWVVIVEREEHVMKW